jgi:ABC-2 type transport system permease protein
MLRVELSKLVLRPRTWITIAVLSLLPVVVAIFLKVTGRVPQPGQGPALLSDVLGNGALFPVAALGLVLPLFLPVAVAIIGGEAIAGEAEAGTLRYLLIRPVSRRRLLVSKLVMLTVFVILTVAIIALVGFICGSTMFGVGASHGSGVGSVGSVGSVTSGGSVASVSGQGIPAQSATVRVLLSVAFAIVSMLGVAAISVFGSVMTESAVGAALAAVAFLVCSEVLDLVNAADAIRPYLPTHYWLAFVDLFRNPILWHNVIRGFLIQGAYIAVFTSAAWARFSNKDIPS